MTRFVDDKEIAYLKTVCRAAADVGHSIVPRGRRRLLKKVAPRFLSRLLDEVKATRFGSDEHLFKLRAADALADEVAVLVRRGALDARSSVADALLDYRDPPSSPRADRLASLERELEAARRAPRPTGARFADDALAVDLEDGRAVSAPLAWFPRLLRAPPEVRARFQLTPYGVSWSELDEDLSVRGLLAGTARGAP